MTQKISENSCCLCSEHKLDCILSAGIGPAAKQENSETKGRTMEQIKDSWEKRDKLRAEGDKLYGEGYKLHAEGYKLHAEGDKLRAEGDKLSAEGDKLYAEGDKFYAEGDKLYAEGKKLRAEGDLVYVDTVIVAHGPKAIIKWRDGTITA